MEPTGMQQPDRLANRLLIVDDEDQICAVVAAVAEEVGFAVAVCGSADEFRRLYAEVDPTVIVLDLSIRGGDGVQLMRFLAEQESRAGVVLMSGAEMRTLSAAERVGAASGLTMLAAIQKPFEPEPFRETLRNARGATEPITADAIRDGLAAGEFTAHYLPIAQHKADGSWRIASVEALVRWKHPQRQEIVYPSEFMQIAEHAGLATHITDFVLQRSVEQARVWHQSGVQIGVAVNFNVGLLADLEVPDRLELLMREYELDPRYLTLEFTEIAPLEEPRMMIDIMTRLRLKGFRLSLDDFGTGYSSFTQLTRMPFNEVKLDRSLMEDVPGRPESETILRALVQLGQTLGITVCAEGIDREDLLQFLKDLGCNRLQGHLISRALTSAEMQEFYHRWNGESLAA